MDAQGAAQEVVVLKMKPMICTVATCVVAVALARDVAAKPLWPVTNLDYRVSYPDAKRGWDKDYLRRVLEPVRAFQRRHGARIYVGEFSATAWADGADRYLADCIALFNEYGFDWTYHAFREWQGWSVECECEAPGRPYRPSADNPRLRALREGLTSPNAQRRPVVLEGKSAGWHSHTSSGRRPHQAASYKPHVIEAK